MAAPAQAITPRRPTIKAQRAKGKRHPPVPAKRSGRSPDPLVVPDVTSNGHAACELPGSFSDQPPTTCQRVSLSDISIQDVTFQYRFGQALHADEQLRASLGRDGQLEPVDLLAPQPYRIINGFRRITALSVLGSEHVLAFIHDVDERRAACIAFIKNAVRRNLTPIDKAHAIKKAEQLGFSPDQVAKLFSLGAKQVHRYRQLLTFPATIQAIVDGAIVTMHHARLLAAAGVTEATLWQNRIQQEHLSASDLKRALQADLHHTRHRMRYIKCQQGRLRVYGCVIRHDAPQADRERLISQLQEAIDYLRSHATPSSTLESHEGARSNVP